VNVLDSLGQTALHRVAQQGNIQACRLLIQHGIDTSIRSLQGYTAAEIGTENIQKMLRGESSDSGIFIQFWLKMVQIIDMLLENLMLKQPVSIQLASTF